jgi:ubiquinone/menaquinone biosynthesis C-methylase UbiE
VGAFSLEIMHMFPLSIGTGIDYAPAAIEIAKVVLPLHRMTVKVGDMQKIDSEGSKFHNVFVPGAFCLLFSMDHAYSTMAELERVLKPGGGLCISLLPSETSASVGACNIRIPKKFWLEEMTFRYGFTVLSLEEMDDWHLPHSMGRYNVCLRKPLK